jgi:hypothetical protein
METNSGKSYTTTVDHGARIYACKQATRATLNDMNDFLTGMSHALNAAIESFNAAPIDANNPGLQRLKYEILWRLDLLKQGQKGLVQSIQQWTQMQFNNDCPICEF